jgi:CBS domain-containing protein
MAAREAFRTLIESGQEQLPVMEDEMLQGILRRRDLIRYVQMRLQQLNRSH